MLLNTLLDVFVFTPCILSHQVTWMRMRDLHILTMAQVTYSADERFQVRDFKYNRWNEVCDMRLSCLHTNLSVHINKYSLSQSCSPLPSKTSIDPASWSYGIIWQKSMYLWKLKFESVFCMTSHSASTNNIFPAISPTGYSVGASNTLPTGSSHEDPC